MMINRDILIRNVKIYNPENNSWPGNAIAIRQNRILEIGDDETVRQAADSRAELIDGKGGLLLPAFYDSHTHFLGYVKRQSEVALGECRTIQEALYKIREKVAQMPEGSWITGGGWNKNYWPADEYPTRHLLDGISRKHFIALDSKDWHTMWVNTPVLKLAGIPVDHPYAGAKHLAVDPQTGEFTGVLEEGRRVVIFDLMPPLNYPEVKNIYRAVRQEFYRAGFAGVHSMETAVEFSAYQAAQKAGDLNFRVFWYAPVKLAGNFEKTGIGRGFGNSMLQVVGAKIFVDGAFGSQTAELFDDYRGLGHAGVEVVTRDQLEIMVKNAIAANLNCAVHAIGDKAIRKTLDVFGKYAKISKSRGLRHRIEHVQLVQPEDLAKFKKHDIIASMQPVHLAADVHIMQKYLGDRCRFTYPNQSLLNAGAQLIFGSDTPIEPFNPWQAIYSAMERKYLMDENQPSFFPEEKMRLPDCLRAYTCNSAYAVGMESQMGKLARGTLADLIIPDRNIFAAGHEIKETKSLLTMINGQIVHNEMN